MWLQRAFCAACGRARLCCCTKGIAPTTAPDFHPRCLERTLIALTKANYRCVLPEPEQCGRVPAKNEEVVVEGLLPQSGRIVRENCSSSKAAQIRSRGSESGVALLYSKWWSVRSAPPRMGQPKRVFPSRGQSRMTTSSSGARRAANRSSRLATVRQAGDSAGVKECDVARLPDRLETSCSMNSSRGKRLRHGVARSILRPSRSKPQIGARKFRSRNRRRVIRRRSRGRPAAGRSSRNNSNAARKIGSAAQFPVHVDAQPALLEARRDPRAGLFMRASLKFHFSLRGSGALTK